MRSSRKYVPFCRTCKRPLTGTLGTFHQDDGTWDLDLSDMTCEGMDSLYAIYADEFKGNSVTETQDEAFDDIAVSHLESWTILEVIDLEH